MDMTDWRSKIDAIDAVLLQLLNLRTEMALEIAKLKNGEGMALRVPGREQEILARMKMLNHGPLSIDSVNRIYQMILDESTRAQEQHGFGGAATRPAPKKRPSRK
jgi:chorismate mutase / prephenate dehydratase